MMDKLIKCLVLLSPLSFITPVQAFWWRSSTTEAPPSPAPVMKQIPLTYFRTYTYQPMAANPLPFPLMSSTDYITNYAALANNPYFNPMMSLLPQAVGAGGGGIAVPAATGIANDELITASVGQNGVGSGARPSKSYEGIRYPGGNGNQKVYTSTSSTTSTSTTTTTKKPRTTTTEATTTTTTTTTTPKPTTSTSSSSTTTTTTENPTTSKTSSTESASSASFIKADAMVNIEAAYPAFNRKVYTNHFNINYNRPVYPYPEYSIYKSGPSDENTPASPVQQAAATGNVEFVPCMCPVNIQNGYPAGIPIAGNPSNSIFLAQGRTEPETEPSMELPAAETAESSNVEATSEELPLTNFVDDLQMVNMDGDEESAVTQSLASS